MSHSFPIRDWLKQLEPHGYAQDPDIRGAYSRMAGSLKLLISKGAPFPDGTVTVDLNIALPFWGVDGVEPGTWSILLMACLRHQRSPLPFDLGGAADTWQSHEGDVALATLLRYGVPWLHEYSTIEKLIDHFEGCLRDGIRKRAENPSLYHRFVKTMVDSGTTAEVRRPPIYHWHLARLYFEKGDMQSSRAHAERFVATFPSTSEAFEERESVLLFIEQTKNRPSPDLL